LRSWPLLLPIVAVCILLISFSSPRALADSTYSVTITVQGFPANLVTDVYVNGIYNGTLAGGASETLTLTVANGPYFISVDSYVQGASNATRYYCQNTAWQAGPPGTQVFTYVAEYFLSVQTAYGSATGQGWYASGSAAHASVNGGEFPEEQGTRNLFDGWSGDANGTQLTSNAITMDGPKVAIATWKTQFFLTIASDPENVTGLTGSGWYDGGTQANFSAPASIPVTSNTRLAFDHWSGEFNGQQPSGSVSMDRPKTVQANYLGQYLLAVQYSPAQVGGSYNETHAGWYDTNSDVQLGPAPEIINVSPVERLQFTGWSDDGSNSNNLSYTVLVDRPQNVTLFYTTQYYLDVRSTYGAVSGSGWYNRGATANFTGPTSSGTWPISYTLTGWTVNPPTGTLTNGGSSWSIVVNGPYTVEAQWTLDYFPLVLLFGGTAAVVTIVAIGTAISYKRGLLTRRPRTVPPQKAEPTTPTSSVGVVCRKCGNNVPKGVEVCGNCGAPIAALQPKSKDDTVYDYIVKHQGVISLRAASNDLGISVDELKEITGRLKKDGRLG